jgi:hypothetical protein
VDPNGVANRQFLGWADIVADIDDLVADALRQTGGGGRRADPDAQIDAAGCDGGVDLGAAADLDPVDLRLGRVLQPAVALGDGARAGLGEEGDVDLVRPVVVRAGAAWRGGQQRRAAEADAGLQQGPAIGREIGDCHGFSLFVAV